MADRVVIVISHSHLSIRVCLQLGFYTNIYSHQVALLGGQFD